jgi:CP family cyanate transporter-like MFS transporter
MSMSSGRDRSLVAGAAKLLCLLWLAGVAMRMTLLTVPPVIPLIHEELRMSETQIGLLIGLPLALFAIAAVPGSLLIARIGTRLALTLGMTIAALAGGARGAATNVLTLYAAAIATGFGIAIMQPGMPTLVREWLPARVGVGTIAYSNGMVVGAMLPSILTIPLVLPLVGGSWRLDIVVWAVAALIIAGVFFLASPREGQEKSSPGFTATGGRWWPEWKNPVVWLVAFAFGCNNSPFFGANAFLGDYLASEGQSRTLGFALAGLNGAQLIALIVLILTAKRLQRRAWPFLLFGPAMLAGFLGLLVFPSPVAIVLCTSLIGISTAITMTPTLALPALLVPPADVPRTAAGMFTISYTCAIVIPTICGALWDLTGKPWTAFVPLCLCCVGLTVFGTIAARYRPIGEARGERAYTQ